MQQHDKVCGFTVTRVRPVEEQQGTLYEFVHDQTGARLIWLDRDEENKTYCIAFPTLPDNDSGMFHILEHSVLNGSRRYPVKAPFVELMKSSLQTFLNAMTYPDRTVYPVSSRNEADFENLVRIYTDAVFHPAIYDTPEIFWQEGWHYEPTPDGSYCRNGVVYNEMKGVFSSMDSRAEYRMNQLLFPDNCYRFESGGHPAHIHELTYEQFVNYHRRCYHPSNSTIFLDGAIEIETILGILDREYLSEYTRAEVPAAITEQAPLQGRREATDRYPAMPGLPAEQAGQVAFGFPVGRYDDRLRCTAAHLLAQYLAGDNTAPLMRALLEQGLAQEVEAQLYGEILQPWLSLTVRNTDLTRKEELREAITKVAAELVEQGLDHAQLAAAIDKMEFDSREQDFGYTPSGVGLAMTVMSTALYGGDPLEVLEDRPLFAALRKALDEGYFETLLRDLLLSGNGAMVCMEPDETLAQQEQQAEQAEVAAVAAGWDDAQRAEVADKMQRLTARQTTPDTPEAQASIPLLELSQVDEAPKPIPTEISTAGDCTVLTHELPTRGIRYLTLNFPLPALSEDDLQILHTLVGLYGDLSTAQHSAAELRRLRRTLTGGLSVSVASVPDANDVSRCKLFVGASVSALDEKADAALDLLCEILQQTQFDQPDRLRELLTQDLEAMRQQMVAAGHGTAMTRARASETASGVVAECAGVTHYLWLRDLLADWDNRAADLCAALGKLSARVMTRERMTISLTGAAQPDWCAAIPARFAVGSEAKTYEQTFTPWPRRRTGIEVPAGVCFAVQTATLVGRDVAPHGAHRTLAKLLSLNYLWERIRVQGGAYSTGMQGGADGSVIWYSFRDPNGANSLAAYKGCGDFIRQQLPQDADLTGMILGTIGDLSPVQTPRAQGSTANTRYWLGITEDDTHRTWQEVLHTTPAQLHEMADLLDTLTTEGSVCVVGGREQLDACELDEIITL